MSLLRRIVGPLLVVLFGSTSSILAQEIAPPPPTNTPNPMPSTSISSQLSPPEAASAPVPSPTPTSTSASSSTIQYDAMTRRDFQFSVGSVFMHRARDASAPLVTNGPGNTLLLDADQYSFGTEPGVDAAAALRLDHDWSAGVRYFWLHNYDSGLNADFTSPVVFQTSPTSTFSSFGTGTSRFEATSAFQSVEFNARRQLYRLGLSGGFRYAYLSEAMTLGFNGTGNTYQQQFSTHNNLYGFQIGGDLLVWANARGNFRLDAFAKTGIYINSADSRFSDFLASNPASSVLSAGSSKSVASLSELSIRPRVILTDHLDVTFGYQLMWLTGMSLTTQQMSAQANLASPGSGVINGGESVYYHGSYVGLDVHW